MTDRWPPILGQPEVRAAIRRIPEDFEVEEIPAYLPCGEGPHLFLEIQKRNRTTDEVVRELARHLGIAASEVGVAGLKDKRALTRQWLSIPASCAPHLATFQPMGEHEVEILRSGLHHNKLKTGHLRGNRFRILLRDLAPDQVEQVRKRGRELSRLGAPNYFGSQRFGRDRGNEAEGLALLRGAGRRHDRRSLRLMLSAVQSSLFNDVLAERLKRGLFSKALKGDVLAKADSGGLFLCSDPAVDQPRLDAFQVHPTGPIFGPKMKAAEGEPGALEQEVLSRACIEPAAWKRFPKLTAGTRRPLRLVPADLALTSTDDGLLLEFTLPPGGYATIVLNELAVCGDES